MVKILSPKKLGNLRIYPAYLDPFSQLVTQPNIVASTLSFAFPYITIPGVIGEIAIVDPLLQMYEQNKCNLVIVSDKIKRLAI